MKKTQNRKIMAALKDLDAGMTQKEVAEKYGIFQGTLSKWKAKYGIISENIPSLDKNIPSGNENIPCQTENIPSLDKNIPSYEEDYDPDYDYDDDANDLLEEYFKTHDRNDVSGIYFDENGKLKIKSYI